MIFHNLVGLYWAVLGDGRERSERMRQHTLELTPAERVALKRARDCDLRPSLRERASAMLQIADGRSARQVARHGLCTPRKPETVCRWLAAYRAHGLAGLRQRPRGTGVVPPQDGQALIETLHQPPTAYGLAQPRWRLADLRAVCPAFANYSLSGLSQALRRLGGAATAGGWGSTALIRTMSPRWPRSRRRWP